MVGCIIIVDTEIGYILELHLGDWYMVMNKHWLDCQPASWGTTIRPFPVNGIVSLPCFPEEFSFFLTSHTMQYNIYSTN